MSTSAVHQQHSWLSVSEASQTSPFSALSFSPRRSNSKANKSSNAKRSGGTSPIASKTPKVAAAVFAPPPRSSILPPRSSPPSAIPPPAPVPISPSPSPPPISSMNYSKPPHRPSRLSSHLSIPIPSNEFSSRHRSSSPSSSSSSALPSPTFPPSKYAVAAAAQQQAATQAPTRQPSLQQLQVIHSLVRHTATPPLSRHSSSSSLQSHSFSETDDSDDEADDEFDVLAPGDIIGENLKLQGELIERVDIPGPTVPNTPAPKFEVIRKLGSGSYAIVYLIRELIPVDSEDSDSGSDSSGEDLPFEFDDPSSRKKDRPRHKYGRDYAIKCLSKSNLSKDSLEVQLLEAKIHQSLPVHPNIVTLHRTLQTSSFLLLILENVPGEDLFYFLERSREHLSPVTTPVPSPSTTPTSSQILSTIPISSTPCTPSLLSSFNPSLLLSRQRLRLIASMFNQMCLAVQACHDRGVSHRDIKPENFMITERNGKVVVKLSDFGLATNEIESRDLDCGSAPYMSYECRNNVAATYLPQAADVWSLGVVLINMLYHQNPWSDTSNSPLTDDPSFAVFRQDPNTFIIQRFPGMNYEVANFLTTRVWNIIAESDTTRIGAGEFGAWAKENLDKLTVCMPEEDTSESGRITPRQGICRCGNVNCDQGAGVGELAGDGDEYPVELRLNQSSSTVNLSLDNRDADSTRTVNSKRRKRGARKGKGKGGKEDGSTDKLEDMAKGAQVLAREISQAKKGSGLVKKPSKWNVFARKEDAGVGTGDGAGVGANVAVLLKSLDPVQPASTTTTTTTTPVPSAPITYRPTIQETMKKGTVPTPNRHLPLVPSSLHEEWPRGRQLNSPPISPPSNFSSSRISLHSPSASNRTPRPINSNNYPYPSTVDSPNWRQHSSTSSYASSIAGTSAFTRFSNGSSRSVSTVATSVLTSDTASSIYGYNNGNRSRKDFDLDTISLNDSFDDLRTPVPSPPSNLPPLSPPLSTKKPMFSKAPGPNRAPSNIKSSTSFDTVGMEGVPWSLGELPRQMRPNVNGKMPEGDIFGGPPNKRKNPSIKTSLPRNSLSPINEKPGIYGLSDATTSTTGLDGDEHGLGVKKVHKGQINALAKMLSALKASRGKE